MKPLAVIISPHLSRKYLQELVREQKNHRVNPLKSESTNQTNSYPGGVAGTNKNPHAVDDKRETSTQQQKQDVKSWATTALEEFRRRRTAETVNRNLKAAQAVCIKLGKAMLGVNKEESALNEKKYVFTKPPTARTALAPQDKTLMPIEQLAQAVPQLYSLSETVFSNKVSDILWQDVKNLSRLPDKSYRYMNERGPDAVAKSFDLAIQCPGDTTASHGIEYLRKFEEKDRIVHIRQAKLLLPGGSQLCGHA
ncbi:hypothetical protein GN244_ATG12824 [Phytophthora infestans]|uniref:Uncharacterized protein n=1 Tax=Phytophthora infestans TaxID=4787 RepID=A0A833W9Y6_PHYIN|nr:hypothetical protein GN244_ATG12824 [Phytophthora infestans]